MPADETVYTYRAGEKVELQKDPNEFVVRALPEDLEAGGIQGAEKVSSASSRVTINAANLEPAMARARGLAPTHHSYRMADTGAEFLISDRVFVTFKEPVIGTELDEFSARYGLVLLETYSERECLFQLTDHTGMNPIKLVVALTEADPLVAMAENDLNYRATASQMLIPTDPEYLQEWHLHTHSTNSRFDQRASAHCEGAWNALGNYGSPDVVIGITDDGCKLDHDDFDSENKFAGWGYFQGDQLVRNIDIAADPAKMYQAGANHGTSCAGVVAGEVDASLTVGAAPGCRLLPVKWESDGPYLLISDSKLLTALDFMADKVDVISNSWGSTPTSLRAGVVINRIRDLAQTGGRRHKGIVFLWAAGNENCPIDYNGDIDIPYTNGWDIRPDGSAIWVGVKTSRRFRNNLVGVPGVLHIAALASFAKRSHYSNYGTGITVCAPSSSSHEYFRLQAANGLGITTTQGPGNNVTHNFGGTSSATPLTAAIAALVISAHPELSGAEVISILKRTASKNLDLEGYPRTPPASFDTDTSWDVSPIFASAFQDINDRDGSWSPWFGHGRVDAASAVAAALARSPANVETLHVESSPNQGIPDNDPNGISDTITVLDEGQIQDLSVQVNIEHSWIGDLVVEIITPGGQQATLHDRSGSNQDNIDATYDVAQIPALAALRNGPIAGNWRLRVRDLATRDTGTLISWAIDIIPSNEALSAEDSAALVIPDDDPTGISRTLDTPGGSVIREIAVAVDITHPFVGDLKVTLAPPDGNPILLHNRSGGAADNIIQTWESQTFAALAVLRGADSGGPWRLNVADVARRDEGKLNRWSIAIHT